MPGSTTLGVHVPIFDEANVHRFRDGGPYRSLNAARAGQGPVNARHLWDEGIALAFGTDTPFTPEDSLAHELRPLRLMFSAQDIVMMITRNAATFLDLSDEIGTLEPGKLADIVIIDGDPLADIEHLLNVQVVIKGGEIVVDQR